MFDQKQRQRMILRYRHVLKQQFPDQSELFFADLSQTIVAAIVTYVGLPNCSHSYPDVPDIDCGGNPLDSSESDAGEIEFILLDPARRVTHQPPGCHGPPPGRSN